MSYGANVSAFLRSVMARSEQACFVEYCVGIMVLWLYVLSPMIGRVDIMAEMPPAALWPLAAIVSVTRICYAARVIAGGGSAKIP